MGDFMMPDASGETRDEGAWKNKVRSLDDTLKSLRGGCAEGQNEGFEVRSSRRRNTRGGCSGLGRRRLKGTCPQPSPSEEEGLHLSSC